MMVPERLFFALWPGTTQCGALSRIQSELSGPTGRPVHPLDIHLTLVFLGPATPEQRGCAEAAAGRLRIAPFDLVLDQTGSFPRARVLWCGISVCPSPLAELVTALRGELAGCGFVLDQRPYRAHATLARKSPPREARLLDPPIPWPVDGFVLAYGQEGPPPRYRILRRWNLT